MGMFSHPIRILQCEVKISAKQLKLKSNMLKNIPYLLYFSVLSVVLCNETSLRLQGLCHVWLKLM